MHREAQFVVRITVREAFGNCSRYVHKYQLVERSAYVPRAGRETPIPDRKKLPENKEVLPRERSGAQRLMDGAAPSCYNSPSRCCFTGISAHKVRNGHDRIKRA